MYEIKFTEIGDRLKVSVNNSPALLNQWYPISSTMKVEKKDPKLLGEPFDAIKYVSKSDKLISNEALIQINYPPLKNIDPLSNNNEVSIANNFQYKLKNYIVFNSGVDRIKITKLETDAGELLFNGIKVYLNQEIMTYDLDKLVFVSRNGIGQPYQTIYYQVGNIQKYSPSYNLKLNIDGKSFLNSPVITKGTTGISSSISNKIENGVPGGKAQVSVYVETNSLKVFDQDTSITINEVEIIKPGEYNFNVDLDSDGQFNFNIYIYSEDVIDDGAIYFNLELKSINNNTELVDQERNKSSIIINV